MEQQPKNLYQRGADDGVAMGGMFCLTFLLLVANGGLILAACGLAAFGYVPYMAYKRMRATYRSAHCLMTFSGLWLSGIVMMLCASLIFALGVFVYFGWVDPGFWLERADMVEQMSQQSASDYSEMVTNMRQMASLRPIDMAITMGWAAASSSCILSAILALIIKSRVYPTKQ